MMLSSQSMVRFRSEERWGGAGRRVADPHRGSGYWAGASDSAGADVCSAEGRYCSGIGEPGNHFW